PARADPRPGLHGPDRPGSDRRARRGDGRRRHAHRRGRLRPDHRLGSGGGDPHHRRRGAGRSRGAPAAGLPGWAHVPQAGTLPSARGLLLKAEALPVPTGWGERYFHFSRHGTTARTEWVAGLTTFVTMA